MSLQQVHLRVNDAATGKPTPVRLRITDANGTYYAPYGRLTEFATGVNQDVGGNVLIGSKKWCYIDGTCEILLPPGPLHIEITKGPEYKPIDETITLLAGKLSLRFTIERWIDMRKLGWYSGDTRVHFLTPDAALLEGQAEDVAVVNLLVSGRTPWDPNILSFSGQSFARETGGCGVAVNTHNVHSNLGSLGLHHCHRVVYPLTSDSIAWTLDDWCGQCHRKNGLVVWTDSMTALPEFRFGEPLVNVILGDADMVEVQHPSVSPWDPLDAYYGLLHAGTIVPLVGASGKDSNACVLGSMRTYAYIDPQQEMTYAGWIEAVRAGRTYVTNGPLLQFTIDGAVPGREVVMKDQGLRIHAEALSMVPFDRLQLRWCGSAVSQVDATASPPYRAAFDFVLPPMRSGLVMIECVSDDYSDPGSAQPVIACSSAVAVRVGESVQWVFDYDGSKHPLFGDLDNLLAWAKRHRAPRLAGRVEQARTTLAERISKLKAEFDRG